MEQFEVKKKGVTFIVFRTERGELFHFRKSVLKRGLPVPPYKTLEEFTRPYESLTLQNCSAMTKISVHSFLDYIHQGKLRATEKILYYGLQRRRGFLVDMNDLKELMARKSIEKWAGQLDWDVSALEKLK